jgi:hypothetical protein
MLYLTRDSDLFGNVSDTVDIWREKPIRFKLSLEAGCVWLPADMKSDTLFEHVSVDECQQTYDVVPTDDFTIVKTVWWE